jgi:hypothetical protein
MTQTAAQCNIPATAAMEAKSFPCGSYKDWTVQEDALSQYNALREHSGLPKVRKLPEGTTFTPLAPHHKQREMALK